MGRGLAPSTDSGSVELARQACGPAALLPPCLGALLLRPCSRRLPRCCCATLCTSLQMPAEVDDAGGGCRICTGEGAVAGGARGGAGGGAVGGAGWDGGRRREGNGPVGGKAIFTMGAILNSSTACSPNRRN